MFFLLILGYKSVLCQWAASWITRARVEWWRSWVQDNPETPVCRFCAFLEPRWSSEQTRWARTRRLQGEMTWVLTLDWISCMLESVWKCVWEWTWNTLRHHREAHPWTQLQPKQHTEWITISNKLCVCMFIVTHLIRVVWTGNEEEEPREWVFTGVWNLHRLRS